MEENNNLTPLQAFFRQNIAFVAILAVLQLIIIIMVAFIINRINSDSNAVPYLTISSVTDVIKGLPSSSVDSIQSALYDAVRQNGVSESNNSEARIRDNSLINKYFERQNINYINFVVDFPNEKQSYQIFHEWSNDNKNEHILVNGATKIMCLPPDQLIYGEFNCKDENAHNGQRIIVAKYISYYVFNAFTPFLKTDDLYGVVYINPVLPEISEGEKSSYIQQTKDAIKELGVSPELFQYQIITTNDLNYRIFENN